MISQPALAEAVLALLVHSSEYSTLLALKITDAQLFTNQTNQTIAKATLDYISKYQSPPKHAINYLLENDIQRGERGILVKNELEALITRLEHTDPAFVLENLDQFLEKQRLTIAFQESLDLIQEGELDKAKERAYKASSIGINSSEGLWMRKSDDALSFLNRDENLEFFSSGVDILDDRNVRPDRKTIMFMIAASGKGKSWWLVQVGKYALLHHKKVLHITLELSQEKTARRYIQAIFGLTQYEAREVTIPQFVTDTNGLISGITPNQYTRESVIAKRHDIRNKLDKWHSCPNWLIKEFPTATLSVEQLYLYIDSLERQKGFKPDVLILDYADLMKLDTQALRIDTGRLYREIRGLGVSKDIAVVTATQGNRDSDSAKLVGSTNVSEDWSKIGTGDIVITYSQTPEEKLMGLARLFVAKSRDSSDRFVTMISQCYDIGQFCVDSVPMNTFLAQEVQKGTA